jgi:hypothetical protein
MAMRQALIIDGDFFPRAELIRRGPSARSFELLTLLLSSP